MFVIKMYKLIWCSKASGKNIGTDAGLATGNCRLLRKRQDANAGKRILIRED
jgi:hypothetical protein